MTTDPATLYQQGQQCFGRGAYREAIALLEEAQILAARGTRLSGEIRYWLVMAYEASGQIDQARRLCRELQTDLLYILDAPKLTRSADWVVQIPDLSQVSDQGLRSISQGTGKPKPKETGYRLTTPDDLSRINTHDNAFLWFGLAIALILGVWLCWQP